MEGEIRTLIRVWLSIIASLVYCYIISSTIPKGFYRLTSLVPVLSLFAILPLYHSSAFLTAVTAFFITWLASFKLLLFAFNLGPLSQTPPISLSRFIAVASFPIRITNDQRLILKPKRLTLNLGTEVLIFSIVTTVLYGYRYCLHIKIVLLLYSLLVFLLIDILVVFCNHVVGIIAGAELEQPSDEPYLSTSLQEFWGRRWNLIVTNTLRHTVFEPVRSMLVPVVGEWAPLLAVVATFTVSGLMHELLFLYVSRATPTWEMTAFFVLHGVCVVVEVGVKKGKLRLPGIIMRPLTVGFVVVTSFWLFFPPLVRSGADVKVIQELKVFADLLTTCLLRILSIFS